MRLQRLLTLIVVMAGASIVSAQSERPYTDYSNVSPNKIESSDLVDALASERGHHFVMKSVAPPIFFETGKWNLAPEYTDFVRVKLAAALASVDLETFEFIIEGHTDDVGSAELNLQLSLNRAETVRSLLASSGVPASRLKVAGLGEGSPRGDNATAAGRFKNRRVEVVNSGAAKRKKR